MCWPSVDSICAVVSISFIYFVVCYDQLSRVLPFLLFDLFKSEDENFQQRK